MSQIELQTVRYTMFNFFQDLKIKVRIFVFSYLLDLVHNF